MLFHTTDFFVFALILFTLLAVFHRNESRKLLLLAASYIFYMWWNPAFIALLAYSTAVDFFVSRRMDTTQSEVRRKALLVISLGMNLGLLFVFKYTSFFYDNMWMGLRLLGYDVTWTPLNITLPVGISFYTFQSLSYTIDVYRRRLPVCRSALDFFLFVSFFPQLVAGPVVRAADFLPQLQKPTSLCFDAESFFLVLRGLVKKVLIADNLAFFADTVFVDVYAWPSIVIWFATICFTIQIYCDFSGYSDVAIGLARMLGYRFTKNFDRPYFSTSIVDFWRRWHISLSTWFRDYLYIPLGGNRGGSLLTARNLMLTMLVAGLWHGAGANFVFWGFLHGAGLVMYRIWCAQKKWFAFAAPPLLQPLLTLFAWFLTQYWVLLTFIAFRVQDFDAMFHVMYKFVVFDFNLNITSVGLGRMAVFSSALLLVSFWAIHAISRWWGDLDQLLARAPLWLAAPVCVLAGCGFFYLWPLTQVPFLYFQF